MRRYFDFVTMEDYVNDTRELAARGVSAIESLREQVAHRERLIWSIVSSIGGSIDVPRDFLIRAPEGLLSMEGRDDIDALRIVARE